VKDRELRRDNYCFVCGTENPRGMKLKFEKRGNESYARFSLPKYYQGYDGIIHGGIISLLLDEAMAYLQKPEERFLTGKITVKFHTPLKVEEEVEVRGWIKENRKKLKVTRAKMVRVSDGKLIAEAEALMFVLLEEKE